MFNLLILFSAVYFLQRPLKPVKVQKPGDLREPLKIVFLLFGFHAALYGAGWAFRLILPSYADLIPGLILLLSFFLAKPFQLQDPLPWLAFCVWSYLSPQAPVPALCKALLLSAGVPILQGAVKGLRFRLALTPSLKSFSTLPGLLFLFSLVALACSAYFRTA